MSFTVWSLVATVMLGLLGFALYRLNKRKRKTKPASDSQPSASNNSYKISYAPSGMEWSGSTSGPMPLKTLTYKQYECLEDARYGFKIVGVTPSESKKEQPHKTRAHGLKTVTSLAKHGFLISSAENEYAITDLGLNALEVCDVRY